MGIRDNSCAEKHVASNWVTSSPEDEGSMLTSKDLFLVTLIKVSHSKTQPIWTAQIYYWLLTTFQDTASIKMSYRNQLLISQQFIKSHFHYLLSYNPWHAKCCFSGPNCTTGLFFWPLKCCTCLIACQKLIFLVTEFLNLWQVGAYVLTLMGNTKKKITLWWIKWPILEFVMTFH
jgi:hypothetical protein